MTAAIDTQALRRIELFATLDPDELHALLKECDEVTAKAGETILEAGQQARALYVLLDGTAEVDLEPARAGNRVVAELAAGSLFGESSFFHASPHTATVKARTDTRLLRLTRDQFERLLAGGNVAALRVAANAAAILAARLQEADRFIVSLLDQIRDEKVHAAIAEFRGAMSHSFSTAARPPMYLGTEH